MKKYDALVIGGGHNGLVAAAYLAKEGRSVCVLERRHVLGGAAVSEEIFPGFRYSVCSYVVSLFRPDIIRDLELTKYGLEILPLDCAFLPLPDGRSLARWSDGARTQREIAKFSLADSQLYPEFGQAMVRLGQFIKPIIDAPPPDPTSMLPRDLLELLHLGKRFRAMPPRDLALLAKIMTMSAADFLDEWFESDVLKAPMSVSGIIGTFLGVRSPGTAYVMLHHYMGEIDGAFRAWGFARGGTGQISLACAQAAQHFGAEIRTSAAVKTLDLHQGAVRGVVLADGEEIRCPLVLSAVDPHRTFLGFVGAEHLEPDFVAQLRKYKLRGSSGKVNLALDRVPEFSCRKGDGNHLRGDIAIAPSLDYLETAYDQAKYGAFSRRPFINAVLPSLTDPSVAPPGKHVMSLFVQYAPYHLREGAAAWPSQRDAFGDAVIDTMAEYIPGFRDMILHQQILTPWDLEQEFGLTEGNIFHGELSLEQLFFLRPVPGFARYKTPIRGLWLCGSGVHPGGGVMGAPGKLAAYELLKTGAI